MKIIIETIPHSKQRYETCGDWYRNDEDILHIKVSDMNHEKYEMLVAVHELIEVILCENNGVTQNAVDEFDWDFEKHRVKGNLDEPGDAKDCPYQFEHGFATSVERMLCAALGIKWDDYSKKVESL